MRKASTALQSAGLPFAVVGDSAIAAWVATADEAAVRNTRDVDVMIRRKDLPAVRVALEKIGFVYRNVAGIDLFLDDAESKARDAVHILYSGEFVRAGEPCANPGLDDIGILDGIPFLDLRSLVQIKLTAYRDKDRTHLRDLIEVGLVDHSWLAGLPTSLSDRLAALLDNPEG